MNPDGLIDAFVSTIMVGVMLVVTIYILSPDIGQVLIGILPEFIEAMIYLLIAGLLVVMIYQVVE